MTKPPDGQAVRGRRRSREWQRLSHGVYHTDDCEVLRAWQLVLPASGRFTHVTAAAAMGWWLPPVPDGFPVVAAVDRTSTRPARAGLHVVRTDPVLPPREVDGVRMDDPAEVLLACARDLALLDMLMLLDSALRVEGCEAADLAVVAGTRRKGAFMLRRALALSDPRAESPWESVLRQFHVTCEVPVVPQQELWTPGGDFVARADLVITGTRTLHEYDGGVHLTREQQRRDLERARRLADAGLERRGYTSYDLLRQPICILRDADRALGRPHDPGRMREWHALLSESLLTASGRSRLLERLGLSGRRT